MKLFLTRLVAKIECPWLDRDMLKGESVWSYEGPTYGCVSGNGRAVSMVMGENPFFELPRDALSETPPPYRLPAGIISENKDSMNMLGDFIAWMESKPDLWETMNGHSKEGAGGYGRWSPDDYYVSVLEHEADESNHADYAVSIFNAMKDLTPFLPEGHMFGFSDGKLGIFECRIKIVEVDPHKGRMPMARLHRIHYQFTMLEKIQKEINAELDGIRDCGEQYTDEQSLWIEEALQGVRNAECRIDGGRGYSFGHVLRNITRTIKKYSKG